MGDSAHERFNRRKDKNNSNRMNEVINELESSEENRRGTSVAASSGISIDNGDMTPEEMMSVSDRLDVESPEEPEENNSTNYILDDQDAIEALDKSYDAITGVIEDQSWSSLENSPLYNDEFVSHLGNLRTYLGDHVPEGGERVLSVPENESEELVCEVEERDYVVSVPENEVYDPVDDLGDSLETLTAKASEETGSRLKMLDMYAQGADIHEAATELGNSFENIYEADEEFRNAGIVDNDGLTEKGMHIYGTVVAQYEELED